MRTINARANFADGVANEVPTLLDAGPQRILFTLSSKERALFLPDDREEQVTGGRGEWFYSCEVDEAGWLPALQDFQPHIVVTNWSSRPIPLAYLRQEDCALRYICHMTGTVRNLVPRFFLERGGVVTNWAGHAATQVAEHALLLALAALRNQPRWLPYLQKAPSALDWPILDLKTQSLLDRRVGLHGTGQVAQALVRFLRPFNVNFFAFSTGGPNSFFEDFGVTSCRSLAELFSQSDILFECEALNQQSAGSVNREVLAALPDGAVFVNVARGALVDEDALLDEARTGRIRVAVDVVAHEPPSVRSPVFSTPGVILSPHIGGPTADRFPALGRFAMENVRRFIAGEPLEGQVTLDVYDRST